MSCPQRGTIRKVIRGEVEDRAASRTLAHVRGCPDCRTAFREIAESWKPAGADGGHAAEWMRPVPADAADDSPVDSEPEVARSARRLDPAYVKSRNKRILFLCGLAALGIMFFLPRRTGGQDGDRSAQVELWRVALASGTPVCLEPAGAFDSRPRGVLALLPPAIRAASVTFVGKDGMPLGTFAATDGVDGCLVTEEDLAAPGGNFRASRLWMPLPAGDVLAPTAGSPVGVVIGLPGGHASSSSVFWLAAR